MIHDCDNCKHAETPAFFEPCASCGGSSYWEPEVKTNYDRIVSKTPEELARWISGGVLNLTGGSLEMATEAWLDWLKQEEKE